ncbi:nucleoside triphosphate pyrophosphatase [Cyanobium sp. CH-040]|uniref:nucleoside triphosphate pyrophosphatase n=1 Tax=Cyanobium sp. CH-040 TaxID=2823708 RepID=UPI0020CE38C2|nr:nucleoside triphosphate pyrophosphatase [Cyanobium sp. CH-040]MCP9928649.1 septum formation inhibitor Maf [Cyanobium sp. CH-040]
MLVLASASPARRRLLEQAAIPHRVVVSGVDEEEIVDSDPRRLVQRLARAKAEAVAARLDPAAAAEPALAVLGCDSLLSVDGAVHGKPADAAEAVARWQAMAGRWGELHTGHCLIRPSLSLPVHPPAPEPAPLLATVTTRVLFADIDENEIRAYVASGEPLRCAGAFALEGQGGLLVERLDGCFSNVIGLSLPLLRRWLQPL